MGIEGIGGTGQTKQFQETGENSDPINTLDFLLFYWDSFDTGQKQSLLDQLFIEFQEKLKSGPPNAAEIRNAQNLTRLAIVVENSDYRDRYVKEALSKELNTLKTGQSDPDSYQNIFLVLVRYANDSMIFPKYKNEVQSILQNVLSEMSSSSPKAKADTAQLISYLGQKGVERWIIQAMLDNILDDLEPPKS